MKRAFTRAGYLRDDVKTILRAEGNRIRSFFAKHPDICPRDLTFLLNSEINLAGALAHAEQQWKRKRKRK